MLKTDEGVKAVIDALVTIHKQKEFKTFLQTKEARTLQQAIDACRQGDGNSTDNQLRKKSATAFIMNDFAGAPLLNLLYSDEKSFFP